MAETRVEVDSLGEVEVPASAYYGAQTERARQNFPVSGLKFQRRFIAALGHIKREAAAVNAELGTIEPRIAEAIRAASAEVIDGSLDAHFPLDIFQTGSGTSTNMNANEVIANRAIELLGGELGTKDPVHPNDHVNASQSSNDVIPTAIHLSAYCAVVEVLEPALELLASALEAKRDEFDDIVKIGRTHLQDAVPIRLGQEFSAYAQQIRNGQQRLAGAKPHLAELALGGTAVGTGLNAPPSFAARVIELLADSSGQPFVQAPNRFEALATKDAAVALSGTLKVIAVSLTKIANDLRWLGSGPRCGLGELTLPSLQPGSSIMPGKVNPVIPESVLMVAAQVIGNDVTISVAGMSGAFELNVMMPVIAYNLLQSVEILASAASLLAERCVDGLEANRERARELVEQSLAMVTALAPLLGYDRAAEIAKEAFASGRTVREVALERAGLDEAELERALDARAQTEGGVRA
jgi:fumarate hydratase class II